MATGDRTLPASAGRRHARGAGQAGHGAGAMRSTRPCALSVSR